MTEREAPLSHDWIALQAERDRLAERVKRMELALRSIATFGDTLSPQEFINVAADALGVDRHAYAGSMDANRSIVELTRERNAALAQVVMLREALEEIAHAPEYDGSLCPDPDDCPNCFARKALAATADAGKWLEQHDDAVRAEEREATTRRFATGFADACEKDGKTYTADCIRRALRGEPPFFEAVAAAIRARGKK